MTSTKKKLKINEKQWKTIEKLQNAIDSNENQWKNVKSNAKQWKRPKKQGEAIEKL